MMDVDTDYWADSKGKDPDSHSKILNNHHRLLWSKRLPNGQTFELESENAGGFKLIYKPKGRKPLYLSSDGLGHALFDVEKVSYAAYFPHENIRKQCGKVIKDFWKHQVGICSDPLNHRTPYPAPKT